MTVYLIDTSVWIDYFQQRDTEASTHFLEILNRGHPYGITSVVYQEVLQGADSERDLIRLAAYLSTQRFYHPRHPVASYEAAARLFFRCRRKGVTIRSTIDCLIAQVAIENELYLVHNDRDFDHIARVIPALRIAAR